MSKTDRDEPLSKSRTKRLAIQKRDECERALHAWWVVERENWRERGVLTDPTDREVMFHRAGYRAGWRARGEKDKQTVKDWSGDCYPEGELADEIIELLEEWDNSTAAIRALAQNGHEDAQDG